MGFLVIQGCILFHGCRMIMSHTYSAAPVVEIFEKETGSDGDTETCGLTFVCTTIISAVIPFSLVHVHVSSQ